MRLAADECGRSSVQPSALASCTHQTKPNHNAPDQSRTLSGMQLKPYLPSTLARSMTSNYVGTVGTYHGLVLSRASPHAAPLKSLLLSARRHTGCTGDHR
jgi:hypothetical protein